MTPGNGFVASIGLDSANPTSAASDAVGGMGPAGMMPPTLPPPAVSSNERKQIMDLLESNKPERGMCASRTKWRDRHSQQSYWR